DPGPLPLRPDAAEHRQPAAGAERPPDSDGPRRWLDRRLRGPPAPHASRLVIADPESGGREPGGARRRRHSRAHDLLRIPASLRGGLGAPARGAGGGVRPGPAGEAGLSGGIPWAAVLLASGALFGIGIAGALLRRNAIQIFLSIELMMNAANLTLLGYGAS